MLLSLLFACSFGEPDPNQLTVSDLENAVPQKNLSKLCAGLKAMDPEIQEAAATNIRIFEPKDTKECICAAIADTSNGLRDGIIRGMKGEKRNAVASCVTDVIKKPETPSREIAISLMADIPAPVVNKSLMELAMNSSDDTSIRATAILAVGGYDDNFDDVSALFDEKDAKIKAAVVEVLGRHRTQKSAKVLIKEALTHPAEDVRAAAMTSYALHSKNKSEKSLCTAMMEDESPKVRAAAVRAFRKTKSVTAVRCLREKAMTLEEDRDVRAAVLDSLKMADGPAEKPAFTVLCDAIPFWLRNYVTDKLPEEDPETDIVKMQNDMDYKNSEKCFAKAYAQRKGLTCHATKYISWFYAQVSAQEDLHVPACPGDPEYGK